MRIVIIGAVAAGTSAVAKARRNNEEAEIVIYDRDSFISYSSCGMPYYIGDEIESAGELVPRDPAFFKSKYNVDVLILHEVLAIQPESQTLEIKNMSTGEVFTDNYDTLVIATGASAFIPQIKGADKNHVFTLRNIIDMNKIKSYITNNHIKSAAIVGTGFVGLELCESLKKLGIHVSLKEKIKICIPKCIKLIYAPGDA